MGGVRQASIWSAMYYSLLVSVLKGNENRALASGDQCTCKSDWNFEGNEYNGCTIPEGETYPWCFTRFPCATSDWSEDDKKYWTFCSIDGDNDDGQGGVVPSAICACKDTWSYAAMTFTGCAEPTVGSGEWCFTDTQCVGKEIGGFSQADGMWWKYCTSARVEQKSNTQFGEELEYEGASEKTLSLSSICPDGTVLSFRGPGEDISYADVDDRLYQVWNIDIDTCLETCARDNDCAQVSYKIDNRRCYVFSKGVTGGVQVSAGLLTFVTEGCVSASHINVTFVLNPFVPGSEHTYAIPDKNTKTRVVDSVGDGLKTKGGTKPAAKGTPQLNKPLIPKSIQVGAVGLLAAACTVLIFNMLAGSRRTKKQLLNESLALETVLCEPYSDDLAETDDENSSGEYVVPIMEASGKHTFFGSGSKSAVQFKYTRISTRSQDRKPPNRNDGPTWGQKLKGWGTGHEAL
jgi:hypothetical protein